MSVAKISNRKLRNVKRIEGVSPSLLRTHSWLGRLPNANLEQAARGSECQLIPAENTIFTQAEGADAVYMVLDGEIRLERREADGELTRHRVFGPFGTFGDVALLGESGRYYSATTNAISVVIRTPLSLLREVLATNPDLAQAWIHAVGAELQRRERRLAGSVVQSIARPAFFDAA